MVDGGFLDRGRTEAEQRLEATLERLADKIASKIDQAIPTMPAERPVAPSILDYKFYYFTYPANGNKKTIGKGITQIDFADGKVYLPDGSEEYLSNTLNNVEEKWIRSFFIDTDKDLVFWLDDGGKKPIDQDDIHGETYQNFSRLYIQATEDTEIFIWACTNPEAFIRRFKPAIFREVINEFNVKVNPLSETGNPIVKLGYFAGSATTYQNLASFTVPANYYGVLRDVSFTVDSNARYKLSIGTTVFFEDRKVVSPPTIPFPPNDIGTARTISLQVKSAGVGTNIEVNGMLTAKLVSTVG